MATSKGSRPAGSKGSHKGVEKTKMHRVSKPKAGSHDENKKNRGMRSKMRGS